MKTLILTEILEIFNFYFISFRITSIHITSKESIKNINISMVFAPFYSAEDISIYNADTVDFMKSIDDGSIDLTVTSPPYDALRDYTSESSWTWEKFQAVALDLHRITKTGGAVVWNVTDQTHQGSESGSSFRQALFFMECGFKLADTMIYKKANPGGARGSNKTYTQCFEYMFVLSKGDLKKHNLIKDRPNKRPGKQSGGGRRNKDSTIAKTTVYESEEFGRRFNIWEYATQTDKFSGQHPAPFPIKLAEDHIISWSDPGDMIFDPFSGSGTTMVAAWRQKRRGIGVDISADYSELAEKRLKAEIELKNSLTYSWVTLPKV